MPHDGRARPHCSRTGCVDDTFVNREKWYQDAVGETPFQTSEANQSPT